MRRYVAALYWAIMTITSIGYGDISAPQGNSYEQVWCAILMLFGGMIWGSVIATFCGVIANLDPAGTEFRTTSTSLLCPRGTFRRGATPRFTLTEGFC